MEFPNVTEQEIRHLREVLSNPPTPKEIGEILREVRLHAGFHQGHMARIFGITVSHYSQIENGTAHKAQENPCDLECGAYGAYCKCKAEKAQEDQCPNTQ